MNGVRRFLGGATTSPSPSPTQPSHPAPPHPVLPLAPSSGKQVWPGSPQSSSGNQSQPNSPFGSPKTTTAALFLRKDKQKPPPPTPEKDTVTMANGPFTDSNTKSDAGFVSSPPAMSGSSLPSSTRSPFTNGSSGPSSPRRVPAPSIDAFSPISTVSSNPVSENKRGSGSLDIKDELLISLLSSEAVVDSRGSEILNAEEVEELKKEYQILSTRLEAMSKKLSLETKIRDAAVSLKKVNAAHRKVSKQSDEQLEVANRRVDAAQKDYWRVLERVNEVERKLLEHRAGVLSFSLRSMEKKLAPNNGLATVADGFGYNTSNRSTMMTSSESSMASASSLRVPFDGAHLFAGHADSIIPKSSRRVGDTSELEQKLKAMTDALNAANQKQVETAQELALLKLAKQEVETTMGMELQTAEDTIAALEKELPQLESLDTQSKQLLEEKRAWERERAERERDVEVLERRLEVLEERSGEATEKEEILAELRESSRMELERKEIEIQELQTQLEEEREQRDQQRSSNNELDAVMDSLRSLVDTYQISSRGSTVPAMVLAIGAHLGSMTARLEEHKKAQQERDIAVRKLEEEILDARRDRDELQSQNRILQARLQCEPGSWLPKDVSEVMSVLQPIWTILPSPEARASKLGPQRSFHAGSPTGTPSSPKSQAAASSSLSDMDVRSLKTLYDSRQVPPSPNGVVSFSIENFAVRVQALVADDRALIERLIRFAQAHDLLKKNAERAQKLAQDSNHALETYQKQVRTLEDRNISMLEKQTALQDELHALQEEVSRIQAEKLEVEMHAAEQAETCRQLTEANNSLGARALALAQEAATGPEKVKQQLEAQLAECRAALQKAQDEINAMRTSERSQQSVLLDELNSMQTENSSLRAQLRALKK